jgi:outer membrane protein OmpA-like peptidoglycan-associated protein
VPVLIALLATLAAWLASCSVPAAGATQLAACPEADARSARTLVVTATATSAEPRPALPASVTSELEQAGRTDHGCILLVAPDGTARALSLTPRRSTGDVEAGNGREILRQRVLAAIQQELGALAATKPGLDVRTAIAQAVRLRTSPGRLVVITSGLSTEQPVDLRRLTWVADGATLGGFLRQKGWLDLTGWEVRFAGIGETAGAQPDVPDPAKKTLGTLWTSICTATGAVRCSVTEPAVSRQPPGSSNTVPIVRPPAQPVPPVPPSLPADEAFERDSAVLAPAADARLGAVVTHMLDADLIVSVVGYADASTGTPEHNLRLSTDRALAVKARLIALGLPADRVVAAYGLGSASFSAQEERQNPTLINEHRRVELRFAPRPTSA